MVLAISWQRFVKKIWEENSLAWKTESRMMLRTPSTWMLPAMCCRREVERVREMLKSSDLEADSGLVQSTVPIFGVVILIKTENTGYGDAYGFVVHSWRLATGSKSPIGFCWASLSSWREWNKRGIARMIQEGAEKQIKFKGKKRESHSIFSCRRRFWSVSRLK